MTREGLAKAVVRSAAEEEIGSPSTRVWIGIFRGDVIHIANDLGFEADEIEKEDLGGSVGAISVTTPTSRWAEVYHDEMKLEAMWINLVAEFASEEG